MFGKKAKEIKALLAECDNLVAEISSMEQTMDGMRARAEQQNAAIADKDQKLLNAQALIQRAEADRDAQKRRADENYAQYRACQKDFDDLKALHINAVAAKKPKK